MVGLMQIHKYYLLHFEKEAQIHKYIYTETLFGDHVNVESKFKLGK